MTLCHCFIVILMLSKIAFNYAQNEFKPNWLTPLAKCCSNLQEANTCYENSQNSITEWLQLPPVYSATNETVNSARFSLMYHNSTCTLGYKSKRSTQFRLHTDGSVNIQGKVLLPNDFCLDESLPAEFTVRYCVPDVCSQTHCIRKCCPRGHVFNLTSFECDPHSDESFKFVFHDRSGQLVKPDPGSYLVQDTDQLECPNNTGTQEPLTSRTRMYSVSPEENADDLFYILADGQIFFPSFPEGSQTSRDYCIDDFLLENDIVSDLLISKK